MKTDPRWEQARELFLSLADLPEKKRRTELEQLASRDPDLAATVRELLRHDREPPGDPSSSPTDGPLGDPPRTPPARDAAAAPPRRFGPYEAVRPIGAGGMGEVFVARRADGEYESEVAVKLLRAGTANEELVRRFLRERQTLARLDHEYIARLLDGGTTESGEPYLVMEYVDGEPADVFAARLEMRERLELFIRIAQAVHHAHERGFVHRDLKPSNILVRPDGTPRLLDFGIARPDAETETELAEEDPLTRTGHRLFTPEYASPEQVRGEIATAQSDIFSLGVLLYAFLCGNRPWKAHASLHELERNICEEDPVPPSRLVTGTSRRRIAGDLDAITLQCLAKRASHRYASAADLCADLERHLAGLPIHARRTGTLGRAVRFAQRKPGFLVASLLLILTLFGFGIAAAAESRHNRRRVELTDAVSDRIAAASLRWSDGQADAANQELDAALTALRELPDEKLLEARVLAQKAVFANMQRDWTTGLALVDRAERLLRGLDEPDPQVVAKLLNSRSFALQQTETGSRAREAARAALDHARAHLVPGDVLRCDALLGWAHELRRAGKGKEALRLLEEAAAQVRQQDPKSETLSRLLNEQAVAMAAKGRYKEAVSCYREALQILTWHRGERHASFAKVRLNLGATLFRLGRLEEARIEHELSLASSRNLNEDLFVAGNQHFLGRIHCQLEDFEAAEAAAREAIAIRHRYGLRLHANRSRCLLGIVQARTDRPHEARATLTPLLTNARPGSFLPDMEADARHRLGVILQAAGERAEARPHLQRALQLKRELLGPTHEDCLDLTRRLANKD